MKKLLSLSIFALAAAYLPAQFHGVFLDGGATAFVDQRALLFDGGGVVNKGLVKNYGNVMLSGTVDDHFATLKADGTAVSDAEAGTAGGRFLNLLNQPFNYASPNTKPSGDFYSYGQLYISGIPQSNITGFATQEFRNVNHGAYEQVALPFSAKPVNTLSTELANTFSTERWSQNEILYYDNAKALFHHYKDLSQTTQQPWDYYILGNKSGINLQTLSKFISGRPYSDLPTVTLSNAGNVNFGANGSAVNMYNERYNSYLQDGFELQAALGGTPWQGNYGKNLYQFGNPFLTNLDLRNVFINDASGENVFLSNIYGIRLEQSEGSVSYTPGSGGGAASFRYVTWNSAANAPVGDVDWLVVRPMSVFTIKLKDNATPQTLDFNNLRRFKYTPRAAETGYGVTARFAKPTASATVKQLGIIAKDAQGKEIGRTYYVVAPNAVSGHSADATMQITAASTNIIGSFEEKAPGGGFDPEYTSKYWLYINEANEADFRGKAIPMVIYSDRVKSLQFEVRENAEIVAADQSLTSGVSFYYQLGDKAVALRNGQSVPVSASGSGTGVSLFYGEPSAAVLSASETKLSRTMVVYSSADDKYIVRFDPSWKTADISVYDMAGRLILSRKGVRASSDFGLDLRKGNTAYVVTAVSESNQTATAKIIY